MKRIFVSAVLFLFALTPAWAELPGDRMLGDYFRAETRALADACLTDVKSLQDWKEKKPKYRQQLFEMLGLSPLPVKSDLKATITGKIEREDFTVEKLHFQSLPGLYVTANLYLPKETKTPVPTILYLCGHAKVFTNGVSLGNKSAYQHHAIWFARNGYACLVVDTLQLGEIEGIHHGTHNRGMWWWNSRGYTPAGVEGWNNIRALDYLETRPEIDKARIGVTGRSGGGAYSWVIAALDDRIAVSAPVAGITDLQNYVVDGKVEGHCDCMFHINTYRWDFPLLAALTAPRPLLFCNSDKDRIFPLDGIVRTQNKVRDVYRLYGATNHFGLLITEGDHEDTQDLQLPVFRWFNRFLKQEDPRINMAQAETLFDPSELKVFKTLPSDSINARIQESFVSVADQSSKQTVDVIKAGLRKRVFAGWPSESPEGGAKLLGTMNKDGLRLSCYEFESQPHVVLRFYVARSHEHEPKEILLQTLDAEGWKRWLPIAAAGFQELLKEEAEILKTDGVADVAAFTQWREGVLEGTTAHVFFAPRGVGLTAWTPGEKKETHIRRRFMLLGQTLEGMRVWDIVCATSAVRNLMGQAVPVTLEATGVSAANVMYAGFFVPVQKVRLPKALLSGRSSVEQGGPDYLNISRVAAFDTIAEAARTAGWLE